MMTTLGMTLKRFRQEAGIKQKDLAKLVDLTPNYLSLVENDCRTPSFASLLKIAKEVKQPLSFIIFTAYEKSETWDEDLA